MARFAVLLAAAGSSSRFAPAGPRKVFLGLQGRAVWLHSAERFGRRGDVHQLIVIVADADRPSFESQFAADLARLRLEVVTGGAARADSVSAGLQAVRGDIEFVAVHDAARPCVDDDDIDAVFAAAQHSGGAILGTPITGTVKRVDAQLTIEATVPRERLWQAQTPQVFRRVELAAAYAARGSLQPTDDAELMEACGRPPRVVAGSPLNLKITTPADLRLAGLITAERSTKTH